MYPQKLISCDADVPCIARNTNKACVETAALRNLV